jgi:O-antigen/teichoic acid export membrane protein
VISGAATYAFFAIASRALTPGDYSTLGVLWTAMFAIGNGIMQPLEQEVARAGSDRRARGLGPAPVIRRAVTIGAVFAGSVVMVALVTHGVLLDKWFDGNSTLALSFGIGLIAFCAGHLTRGVLSSHHRFGAYSRFFSIDGISRVALAGLLAVIGVKAAGGYGLVLAITPFIGVLAALVGQKRLMEPGPEAPWSELTAKLGWLLLGTVCISLVVQAGTIAVDILATPDQADAAGVFLNGLTTARIPLFLFQAILASLLPKLSRLASHGHFDEFTAQLKKLVGLILGVGVITTALAALLGPAFIAIVYKSPDALTSRDLALLAAAFILIMATICLDQALIALNGHSRMAVGWLVSFGVFVGVTAVGGTDLYLRVELGLLSAAAVAFAWMSAFLAERLRHHATYHAVDEAEALAEIPFA